MDAEEAGGAVLSLDSVARWARRQKKVSFYEVWNVTL